MPSRRSAFPYLSFYLQGREDASDRFEDGTDFDADALAREITSPAGVSNAARSSASVVDGLDWSEEASDMASEPGVDKAQAARAWKDGFRDEVAAILEAEIVNALVELAEEDTAVETPSSKARTSKRNPAGDSASYGDWFQTGIRDCENTFDATDLDDEINSVVDAFQRHRQDIGKLAAEAVKTYWKGTEPESKAQWMAQNEHEVRGDHLKPDRAYEFWADGWRTQAQKYVAEKIVERAES